VARKDVADAFLEEVDFITNFFQTAGLGVSFYWNSYSYPQRQYKNQIR
jgi:hypothetical protein